MANAATGAMRMGRHSLAGKARWLTTAANSLATHHSPQPTPGAVTSTMPPGFVATVGKFETFVLPEKVVGSLSDVMMAKAMINAWRKDGILQVAMSSKQERLYDLASKASKNFFRKTPSEKHACVNDSSFCGYVASGEEITEGIADYSEIFTVSKNLRSDDPRVLAKWPCHGPCPWPDKSMERYIMDYVSYLGTNGEKLLQMIELGLGVPPGSLTKYTQDGFHHMRVLRFPSRNGTNGKGKPGRGIGAHRDYGLLVMAAQDDVGGLFIRPPYQGDVAESIGDESGWTYVAPTPGVFTVFPGDMMQYMTNSLLQSTPHKVGLNVRERFAFAYFHEPNFKAVVKPLPGFNAGSKTADGIHYGTYFTNMVMRNYPDRGVTKKLLEDGRCAMLESDELQSDMAV
ncbi:probable ethylene-forming enzyme [Claviceps purpurea 20.1]|uniref:Probable ethylene-forming enzyme n=1 Tax=Claviceps purpurea (strain 20.1) TaxID=1111077 RepID=M1WGW5_CLAP2|nr:probable ethylene-forming enzyme [Claviceps purpurea 20.1]